MKPYKNILIVKMSSLGDVLHALPTLYALRENCPGLRLEDTGRFYDVSVFNRAAETGTLLLTLECWKDVHPGLKALPVNWDFTIPYGLLYAPDPPEDVAAYVRLAAEGARG